MPCGPRQVRCVPSTSKVRPHPSRTLQGDKGAEIANNSCKSHWPQALAFCKRLRERVGRNPCKSDEQTPHADMLKGMRRVDGGQESSQQITRTADFSRPLPRFEGSSLLLRAFWQARNDFLVPIVVPQRPLLPISRSRCIIGW